MNLTLTGDVNMKRRIEEQEKVIEQVRRTLRATRGQIDRAILHYDGATNDALGVWLSDLAECERALAKVGKGET